MRSGVWANDGCESSGQFIPFPKTQADRLATGDPRLSAEERYGSYGNYSFQVAVAVKKMIANRYLLAEDGVAVLNDCKYGWDKPDDGTLRLTLIHGPHEIEKDRGR